ncbi:MAG: hypothetical protein PVI66_07380 [Candidatus Aminicenantes bacterium]|jgi:hypothetical protein
MLKRYQVLLPDWLEDYLKWGVKKYKLSFSEIIRLEICFSVLAMIDELHPEYKANLTIKEIISAARSFEKSKLTKEDINKFASRVYFETRKAIEYRTSKAKKQ